MPLCPRCSTENPGQALCSCGWVLDDSEASFVAAEPALGDAGEPEYLAYDLIAPLDAEPEWA